MSRAILLQVLAAMPLLLTTAAVVHAQQPAAAPAADARVETALKGAQLGFLIDEGDYRLDYKVDETRSQRVWVASGTTSLPPLEVRDVWSVAARGKGRRARRPGGSPVAGERPHGPRRLAGQSGQG
ncbi:MAG: hypothetical protein IPJ97_09095 [Proteobacteria bacterium]|nr:hypothetical protein [Pseudomonadota bacterium]